MNLFKNVFLESIIGEIHMFPIQSVNRLQPKQQWRDRSVAGVYVVMFILKHILKLRHILSSKVKL